jgi:hypothetical protein
MLTGSDLETSITGGNAAGVEESRSKVVDELSSVDMMVLLISVGINAVEKSQL